VNWRTVDRELKKDLEIHWAGLFGSGKEFNAYEWRKHGTCMDPFYGDLSKMPPKVGIVLKRWRELRKAKFDLKNNKDVSRRDKRDNSRDPNKVKSTDEYEHNLYFKASIALNKNLNLKRNLAKQGIKPSPKRFKLKKLQTAVYRAYGIKNFYVRCDRGKGTRRSEFYISEIRFCYDLNFKLVNCKRRFYTTCDDHVFMKK
jgi:ribonuclease I